MEATEIVEKRVDTAKLQIGMYVCRLDRPWLGTPFQLQGLLLSTPEDIDALAQHCEHVFIDDLRSIYRGKRAQLNFGNLQRLVHREALERLARLGYAGMRGPDRTNLPCIAYPPAIELAKELPRAINAWKQARVILNQCVARAKNNKPLNLEDIDMAIEPVVESVVRSPDAALWLVAVRRSESYPISHPLNCCAMLLAFARFLGFPPELLLSMAKGALLMDIGMWRLGQNYYINRDQVADEAKEEIRDHVLRGLEYLRQSGFVDLDAVLTILHHHERHDGNGYPRQVRPGKVSLMGHMLHIVDTFDALCSKRSYRSKETSNSAQRMLHSERDQTYPAEVVEAFLHCLGVYPTGTLVELSTGEIAAVSGQVLTSRLYPRLIVLTHSDQSARAEFEEVESSDLIKLPRPVKIVRTVASGSVNIRLASVEPQVRAE